ncbi:hypothetical protein GCM10011487_20180 [Steroidobacter agaridevorans]|uniref:VOC domain-containing protein n=1 Tax=Steroidobacter agaridevorans TaxID=2695856 RepID=A0A829YB05_9GAMM|nr:VOC family protein [Steroidobacter agaridevorans]GFE80018.1 hypothetical protein GCM10011487_20180 [Steroidobacter agaridevorans]
MNARSLIVCFSLLLAPLVHAAEPAGSPTHSLVAAKVIVADLKQALDFYQQNFGLKEVARENVEGQYDQVILGFGSGVRLTLVSSPKEQSLQKSRYPVVLIYTPDFETIVKRLEDTKQPVRRLPKSQSGPYNIAIARDPSGNAVEILARQQPPAIGAAKLIVADRKDAEEFYTSLLHAKPLQYFNTPTYDEVLLGFNDGMLALFQPKDEAPLPKSQFPLVTFRTRDIDVTKDDSATGTSKDPSGNVFEIFMTVLDAD